MQCLRARDGEEIWRFETKDLSGLLTRPVATSSGLVVIASIDGALRALDERSGTLAWEIKDLPSESRPALLGQELFVATTDARLVTIDWRTGQVKNSKSLDGSCKSDLVANQSFVVAITSGGMVYGVRPGGGLAWSSRIVPGQINTPLLAGDLVLTISDEGVPDCDGHPPAKARACGRSKVWARC